MQDITECHFGSYPAQWHLTMTPTGRRRRLVETTQLIVSCRNHTNYCHPSSVQIIGSSLCIPCIPGESWQAQCRHGCGFNDIASSLPTLCPDCCPHVYAIQSEFEPDHLGIWSFIGSQCEQDPIYDCPDLAWSDDKIHIKTTTVTTASSYTLQWFHSLFNHIVVVCVCVH